jgi:hypothetical protein
MKWIFTQPGISVLFEKGEPYCHIFPVQLGALETIEPELRLLSENPELKREQRCLEREPLSIQHRPEGARLRRSSREVAEALLPWPRSEQASGRGTSHAPQAEAVQAAGLGLQR